MKSLKRHYFRRVLRPISRMQLSPQIVANTMAAGLGVGLIAPPGIQLGIIGIVWAAGRPMGLRFNLPIAAVLTLVTNPFTFVPIYTMYFAIGCTITACGAGDFQVESLLTMFQEEGTLAVLETSGYFMLLILLGGLPFCVGGGVGGYYFGRALGRRLEMRRLKRLRRHRSRPSPVHNGAQRPHIAEGTDP